jgi:energy-coupling factor transporter ATP-binding protein EcfA2
MILIGITGPIGHGKSTLAHFLAELEPTAKIFESSEVISDVASELNTFMAEDQPNTGNIESINTWLSHLPTILSSKLGGSYSPEVFVITKENIASAPRDYEKLFEYIDLVQTNPGLVKTPITQENKAAYRAILQWIGGLCVTHIRRTIWNEELIRRANRSGSTIAILGGVRFAEEAQNVKDQGGIVIGIERPNTQNQDSDDPTERERSSIIVDTTVVNDGDMAALKDKAKLIFSAVTSRQNLHTRY